MPSRTWSYSSLKTFQSCPKKYYHLRVLKDIKEPESEQMRYGQEAHKAAELYIKNGTDLPPKFEFMRNQLDTLKNLEGEKFCELKCGLTKDLEPCDFFAKDVWLRAVIDLLVVNEETGIARIIDYKFGKSKNADMSQLQLMALVVFKMFPKIKKVRAGLLFCPEDKLIPTRYNMDNAGQMWMDWLPEVARLEEAYTHNVWNANPSGLCKAWCPVLSCAHNGRR
jgi:hypothetical protein